MGLIPSCTIDGSPKGDEIQVGERMNVLSVTPSSFCRFGTIWMALEPFPITPTVLLVKSKLDRPRSTWILAHIDGATYDSSHCPECTIFPLKVCSPGISGHLISFNCPRAVISTLQSSSKVSPVFRFRTVSFLDSCQHTVDRVMGRGINKPFLFSIVPDGGLELVRGLDVPHRAEFLSHILEVLLDLSTGSVQR